MGYVQSFASVIRVESCVIVAVTGRVARGSTAGPVSLVSESVKWDGEQKEGGSVTSLFPVDVVNLFDSIASNPHASCKTVKLERRRAMD